MAPPHSFTHGPIGPRDSLDRPLPPSPQQRDAIRYLISSNNCSQASQQHQILGRLEITRGVLAEFKQRAGPDCPSGNEFAALLTLVPCNNDDISAWLQHDQQGDYESFPSYPNSLRNSTASSSSSSRNSSVSSRKSPRNSSDLTTPRSSVRSFALRQSYLKHQYQPEKDDQIPDNSIPTNPQSEYTKRPDDLAGAEAGDKKYKCSTGAHEPKARSSTIAAFIRHEWEHVHRFYCVSSRTHPDSLEEQFASGKRCTLCRKRNRDPRHFEKHRLQTCLERDEPLMYTRRDVFAKHLKDHHDVDSHSFKELVSSPPWYSPLQNSVFTCGICVGVLFDSKEKQLDHITKTHLNDGQSMKDWDQTRMMRSLLRHPQINQAWNLILDLNPNVVEQFLFWPKNTVRQVPLELDLDSGEAENFATAAFDCADTDYANGHQDNTRTPLPITNGGTIESLPNPIQGLQSPSISANIANFEGEKIESCYDLPTTIEPNSHSNIDRIDQAAMELSIHSHGDLDHTDFGLPPPRSDSFDRYPMHTSRSDTDGSSDQMQILEASLGTISPSHLSTAAKLDPSFHSMNSSASGFNRWNTGPGSFLDHEYAGYPSNETLEQSAKRWGRHDIVHQAYAQHQQWSPGYTTPPKMQGIQGLSNFTPASAPLKRKVSANKAKIDGSGRRPWEESSS